MTPDILISRIEQFARDQGLKPATVTSRAVDNSRLYARLKSGGGCTLQTAAKLLAFMEGERGEGQSRRTHVPEPVGARQQEQAPVAEKGTA